MQIPEKMEAMVLETPNRPLCAMHVPVPKPTDNQVLIRVHTCGVCRTDLHIVDGELTNPKLPLILGHEIVGTVVQTGTEVVNFQVNDRVGVPWLGYTCGQCRFCQKGQENLCDNPLFTGYTIDGGYAEYTVADQRYCFHLPAMYNDAEAAPLLCAGLIGYRTYRLAGENIQRLGIYGFGAAAHIIAQVAIHEGKQVYAFTRPGDSNAQQLALQLGAVWADDSTKMPPDKLDAAMIFAPVGPLVPAALQATARGGTIVSGGIYMSDIPSFPYSLLWEERIIRSVANLTRQDGDELMNVASKVPIQIEAHIFPFKEANNVLNRLRQGKITGAAVLRISCN